MSDATNLPESTDSRPQPDEDILSSKITLADLCAKGTAQYAVKNYLEALDYYGQASELQAEINGEMAPENAEILFLYGRCLYKVGQSKSDVLGGNSSGQKKESKSKGTSKPETTQLEAVTEEDGEGDAKATAAQAEQKQASKSEQKSAEDVPQKPLFSFTGDENFEESDEEDEGGEGEDEDEEDELSLGFAILDLARILLERRLEQPQGEEPDGKGKGKVEEDSSMTRHLKERLADTYDLLGDISLENERFPNAIADFRASLAHKQQLYPKESEIIAEAHFKLCLALEFGSITTTSDADDGSEQKDTTEPTVNEEMREEAAKQLELSIESTKLKLHNQEVSLAETSSPDENDTTRSQIAETKEILQDMEQRLIDLRAPTFDLNDVLGGVLGTSNGACSIVGTKEGETRAEADARIEEAKKNATDLSGLARKKAPKPKPEAEPTVEQGSLLLSSHLKRKPEDDADSQGVSKKTKVDE